MNMNIPTYEPDIDELDEFTGISLISIVHNPAMESNYVALSTEVEEFMLAAESTNKEKQTVTGAVLIPEKLIPRIRKNTGERFNLRFSAAKIEKMRNKFFRTGNLKQSNLDHSKDDVIEAYLIESWIVEDEKMDKAVALGLQDVKKGTFYATYHFPDTKVWELVKERNGFSIEAFMSALDEVKMEKVEVEQKEETIESLLEDLLDELGK